MTHTEARDRIAVLLGWQREQGDNAGPRGWRHERWDHYLWMMDHPIPHTLDAIAALWEKHCKGWSINLGRCDREFWSKAAKGTKSVGSVVKTYPTMIEAWTRLLLAVLEVQHETKV